MVAVRRALCNRPYCIYLFIKSARYPLPPCCPRQHGAFTAAGDGGRFPISLVSLLPVNLMSFFLRYGT